MDEPDPSGKSRLSGQRVLLVSNRLPISIYRKNGRLRASPSVGGLATALSSVNQNYNCTWIGWPGIPVSPKKLKSLLAGSKYHPVSIPKKDSEKYYHGFSNKTIWPLFHYFPALAEYDAGEWESYKKVNMLFCDKVAEVIKPGDVIWIHDYHLMLLPQFLRERFPGITIGFFLHVPFPSYDVFRLLPWRKEIIDGLLGADLVGFHTYEYASNFLNSVLYIKGLDNELGRLTVGDRAVKVDTFPLGIDFKRYSEAASDAGVRHEIEKFKEIIGERKIVLSIDRLDYTKGVPQRLQAFDAFLRDHPEWREKVTLALVVSPSRSEVPRYSQLKKEIDEKVGRINGKYSKIGWSPVLYIHRTLPFSTLAALYVISDAALVTPIRDGMNLVSKEYVATNADGLGVLILSEMAGAAKEMSESIIVNPNSMDEMADALERALKMPHEEQIARNRAMQERLRLYDSKWWAEQFIAKLHETKSVQQRLKSRKLDAAHRMEIIAAYRRSPSRLILLDYDGTLVPFAKDPSQALPSAEVLGMLRRLAARSENEVVIVSGRDRKTLEGLFRGAEFSLIAEHGVWTKRKNGGRWEIIEPLASAWKKEVAPIFELFTSRLPNSFVEQKEFSIAWHYRGADSEEGELRARELLAVLSSISANIDINVLYGNKVIEVRNSGINKGRASLRFLSEKGPEFILAIGDDWTDESLFKALPPRAYSIKVGMAASNSRFNFESQKDVLTFLDELAAQK